MSCDIAALRQVELFNSLNDNDLAQVAGMIEETHYENLQTIIEMNSIGATMHIIKSGGVNIYFKRHAEGEFMLRHLTEGKHFGEMSLFDDQPRSALVKAVGPTMLYEIHKDRFFEFLDTHKDAGIKILMTIIRELSARLRLTSRELYISMGVGEVVLDQDEVDKLREELMG
jgi:CRP-like cAMP-binding protein